MTNYFAGDLRRAGLAIRYHGQHNSEGLNAIVSEAAEQSRITELLQAIVVLHQGVIEVVMTPVGMYSIALELRSWSDHHDDPDIRRAATWICAQGANDLDAQNRVLVEASQPENRIAQLVACILGVHAVLVPASCTAFGLERMQEVVDRMILRENGIDPDAGAA